MRTGISLRVSRKPGVNYFKEKDMISFKEWFLKKNMKKLSESIEKIGTKINKEKLIEAIKNSSDTNFYFAKDAVSAVVVVRAPLS